ncbi:MAG: DNA polymerase IV [Dehalococcoidia bacterium]
MPARRIIMHVDLDAFFVAVEQARAPELRAKPVIVGGDPDGRGVVATASYEARVFGIYSGMALRTAKRLCPHAIFVRGNYREYERVSNDFHAILREFSPLVQSMGLDEAFLDLTGCEAIVLKLGAPQPGESMAVTAANAIRQRVHDDLGITASAGIAGGRTVAKIASDAAKPNGVLEIPAGHEGSFLAPRPVRHLPGLGPKAEAELARLGVRTLGQLAALPTGTLRALFGSWGPALGERARGIDNTPVAHEREPAKSVGREGTYAHDIDDVNVLRASLRGYAESVGAELRRIDRRARHITIKLRYGDFTTVTRRSTFDQPTHSDDELYVAAVDLLAQQLQRDGRAVRLIGLSASGLVDNAVQLDLFEARTADPRPVRELRLEALAHSIDALRAKYGHRAVQTGLTLFDPFVSAADWEPHRRTGLSSQVGLNKQDDE